MKKQRGPNLDTQLKQVLEEMLEYPHTIMPITRTTVQKRLNLKSRSTLIGRRAELIEEARVSQLANAGLDPDKKKRRSNAFEQLEKMKIEKEMIRKERDNLIEKLAMIVNAAQARGLVIEELLMPLRNK